MNVYAVVTTSLNNIDEVKRAVETQYPNDHIQTGVNSWMVADQALDIMLVSKKIGLKDKDSGTIMNVLIFWVPLYWGNAPTTIWSWLSAKLTQK